MSNESYLKEINLNRWQFLARSSESAASSVL